MLQDTNNVETLHNNLGRLGVKFESIKRTYNKNMPPRQALPVLTSLEICAGAGGQALGLEQAGFEHTELVEIEPLACATLRHNRPAWRVLETDLRNYTARHLADRIDLLAGGVPCPPFSVAGKQLGQADERDLFPEALRLVAECRPKAVMLENVRGLLDPKFTAYRQHLLRQLADMGYTGTWRLMQASDYGVAQLRPRAILVALAQPYAAHFEWPAPSATPPPSVGQLLLPLMKTHGWPLAEAWAKAAQGIAPTLVGGSKKHGGADLGPTRARKKWAELGIDGRGLADTPPTPDTQRMPRLTLQMAALIQGFPPDWTFVGKKTPAYRQVGNAFPPPVARAIGTAIRTALCSPSATNILPDRLCKRPPTDHERATEPKQNFALIS